MAGIDPALEAHRQAIRQRLTTSTIQLSGPGTVTWKINREIIVVAGWGRAILLQLAHPLVAAGVLDHSTFNRGLGSSFARLFSTVRAMLSLTFGSEEEIIATAAAINRIHDRVIGNLREGAGAFPSGTPYSAHQADLLRWVHLTLLESIPLTYELLIAPLSDTEKDQYCLEASVMEPLMGIPAGSLPRRWREVAPAIAEVIDAGHIAPSEGTRQLGRDVLFPQGSWVLWPLFRPVRLITIGLLSPRLREIYGFSWHAADARALSRWVGLLRRARRLLPSVLREWRVARVAGAPGRVGDMLRQS